MGGDKFQATSIDAKTFVGGSIKSFSLKHVSQVAATFCADDFLTDHAHGVVFFDDHILGLRWIEKGRPTTAGIKLLFGCEQQCAASGTVVTALPLFFKLMINFPIWTLRSRLAEYAVLLGSEFLFPFRIGFSNLRGRFGWGCREDFHGCFSLIIRVTSRQRQ